MPQPALAPGAHGVVTVKPTKGRLAERAPFAARTRYREVTGEVREIRRLGETPEAAREALNAEVVRRQAMPTDRPEFDTLTELLDWYWSNVVPTSAWSDSTRSIYEGVRRNHLDPGLGALPLEDLTLETVERFVNKLEGHRVRQLAWRLLNLVLAAPVSGR